jgi:hypothetical protein
MGCHHNMGQTTPGQKWVSTVESLASTNPRYLWLLKYLQRDKNFLHQHLRPIEQGSTRTIIADLSSDASQAPSINRFMGIEQEKEVSAALEERKADIQLRLVFMTSVSGVDFSTRQLVNQISSLTSRALSD